mmetsp:Transcript_51719/g.93198  ORF Transcript_51719/g.93198 Transcript_51719/m.93198 type:complete len:801 (+) Transcript_51719:279-2681(+)
MASDVGIGVELTFQRASVHMVHDVKRLEDGEDLNDALLDFFVKLGQALIPEGEPQSNGGVAPVAYLGSYFYGMLQKGNVTDGRVAHANVANWAKRRLGKGGLFGDGVGAFAVPVNELLSDYMGRNVEKHWWLALLTNPRGASGEALTNGEEAVSVICLDSFARTAMRYKPPRKAVIEKSANQAYSVEVSSFSRSGFVALANFRAQGDGSAGPLMDPRKSRLQIGARMLRDPELDLKTRQYGDNGKPGVLEGTLEFAFDSSARICGEYVLHYAGFGEYKPALKLELRREPNPSQTQVAQLLGGYIGKEWEISSSSSSYKDERVADSLVLADSPQQETSHDCGFFILEQILRLLQLSPEALRALAKATPEELSALPWPTQREVAKRKQKLREVTAGLFAVARSARNGDVEALLKDNPVLRQKLRAALWEGNYFARAVATWMNGGVDPNPLPESELTRTRSSGTVGGKETAPTNSRVESENSPSRSSSKSSSKSSSSSASRRKRRRKKSRSRSRHKRSRKSSGAEKPPPPPSFTKTELEGLASKILRTYCIQYKVLPAGMIERTDLLKALAPLAVSPAPKPQPAPARPPPPRGPVDLSGQRSDLPKFTTEDLQTMKVGTLRMNCIQYGVLPPGFVEKDDLVKALMPLATKPQTSVPQRLAPQVSAASQAASKMEKPKFTTEDVDAMKVGTLRTYCIQYGVLPAGSVEKDDLVQALKRFATKPTLSSAPPTSGGPTAFGQGVSAGAATASAAPAEAAPSDSFNLAELGKMSVKNLRNFCIKHGVMPHGPVEKCDLVVALAPFAK